MQAIVKGFQMDIRCSQVYHPTNDGVDQSNNGRLAGKILQMLNEVPTVGPIAKAILIIVSSLFHGFGKCLFYIGFQRKMGLDAVASRQLKRLHDEGILRHCHGNMKPAIFHAQWIQSIGMQKIREQPLDLWHEIWKTISRHTRNVQLHRQCSSDIGFRYQPQADKYTPQHSPHFLLRRHGTIQIAGAESARL